MQNHNQHKELSTNECQPRKTLLMLLVLETFGKIFQTINKAFPKFSDRSSWTKASSGVSTTITTNKTQKADKFWWPELFTLFKFCPDVSRLTSPAASKEYGKGHRKKWNRTTFYDSATRPKTQGTYAVQVWVFIYKWRWRITRRKSREPQPRLDSANPPKERCAPGKHPSKNDSLCSIIRETIICY